MTSAPFYDAAVIRLKKDGVIWHLDAGFQPFLERLLQDQGQPVKQSPVKLVTRHLISGRTFFKKVYSHQSVPLRPLKFFFKPSQARQEWDLAQRLQAMEVPIVKHVALGERWSWRGLKESILITEGFDGEPVNELADANPSAVLAFVNQLHSRGVLQTDLHPGNILCNAATGEMRLVDLHGILIKPSLASDERAANLAFLRIFMPIPVAPEIQQQSECLRNDYFANRSKRCLKHNRDFAPRTIGALRWRVRLSFVTRAAENILREPDAFLARDAEILKRGRSSTVGKKDGLVLKRYNLRKWENLVKDLFRASKARRAYQKAYHLELAGISTARPIATADQRWGPVSLRSYLLMEEIPDAVDLGKWRGDGRVAARVVADLLGKLHNEGFMHRDLKETNIVFDGNGRAFLLDLEGVDYLESISNRRAAADLERLACAARNLRQFSREDWRVFIRRYCKVRGIRARDLVGE